MTKDDERLTHPDPKVRKDAIRAGLAKTEEQCELALNDPDHEVRYVAIQLGLAVTEAQLKRAMNDPDTDVGIAAENAWYEYTHRVDLEDKEFRLRT